MEVVTDYRDYLMTARLLELRLLIGLVEEKLTEEVLPAVVFWGETVYWLVLF